LFLPRERFDEFSRVFPDTGKSIIRPRRVGDKRIIRPFSIVADAPRVFYRLFPVP
jgi:hypothetical protein